MMMRERDDISQLLHELATYRVMKLNIDAARRLDGQMTLTQRAPSYAGLPAADT